MQQFDNFGLVIDNIAPIKRWWWGKPIPPKFLIANENCDRVITTIGVLITSLDTRFFLAHSQLPSLQTAHSNTAPGGLFWSR